MNSISSPLLSAVSSFTIWKKGGGVLSKVLCGLLSVVDSGAQTEMMQYCNLIHPVLVSYIGQEKCVQQWKSHTKQMCDCKHGFAPLIICL